MRHDAVVESGEDFLESMCKFNAEMEIGTNQTEEAVDNAKWLWKEQQRLKEKQMKYACTWRHNGETIPKFMIHSFLSFFVSKKKDASWSLEHSRSIALHVINLWLSIFCEIAKVTFRIDYGGLSWSVSQSIWLF